MTIKNIYILGVTLFFIGCSGNQERIKRTLTNDNFKFWFRYHRNPERPYSLGYCFYSDGTFTRYFYPDSNKNIRIINESPSIFSEPIWKIVDDSTLMIGKDDFFKIIAITMDSVVLKGKAEDDFLKLHVERNQITKPIRAVQ